MIERIDLCGTWKLNKVGDDETIAATVPGCVHTDLLAAKKIDDPYYRDNEDRVQWVSEAAWVYSRTFDVAAGLLESDVVLLRCEGLDTLAKITINGRKVAKTDNMFRTWEFDVRKHLQAGANTITVRFGRALKYAEAKNRKRTLPTWAMGKGKARSWIRKEQCNFGWDWGPTLITCGIWRDIAIVAYSPARLAEVQVGQTHRDKGVELAVTARADVADKKAKLTAAITVTHGGKTVAEESVPFEGGKARAKLTITDPKLWWPNGMGGQPLYEVTVDLIDADGEMLDARTKRVGLRTLNVVRKKDKWGESFAFAANGVTFFAKGANWIPGDTFQNAMTVGRYGDLLGSAVAANMNMLRVWGGGIYETDTFYDICDEMGLCVWQDFMFACGTYPTFDDDFMASVKAEAADNVKRLRHHPCIALWCGNNELEQGLVGKKWNKHQMSWSDYGKLFDKMLPRLVKSLDPQRDYWPGSPHSPHGKRADHRNVACGDAHLWDVWHGRKPFEWYRTTEHRFVSEFGFQSFPEPKTVRGYTAPEDRNVTSSVMEHHQRSGIGNTVIMQYMLEWFRMPKDFDASLWAGQILQGMGIKYAVEHWRRNMPRSMGALYWQLNDCWPVASWASIDYHGRWKALHYMAAKFYAPVMVSAVEDGKKGTVDVFVTSDEGEQSKGKLVWTLITPAGKTIVSDSEAVDIPVRKTTRVVRLDLADPLAEYGADELMLFLELSVGGRVVSTNFASFAKPKRMALQPPKLAADITPIGEEAFMVTLRSDVPALWAWLELTGTDARMSDNFVHVYPGAAEEIVVCPAKKLTEAQFLKKLKIRSLVDTY